MTLKNKYNRINLIIYALLPFILNYILECFERKSLIGGLSHLLDNPMAYICNVLILLCTLSISFLFRRRIFVLSLISAIWITFGIANYILLCNRVMPFTAYDLKLITAALNVLQKYFNGIQIILIGILALFAVAGLCLVFIKTPKSPKRVNFIKSFGIIALTGLFTFLGINAGIRIGSLETKFGELSESYLKNGFVYCFASSLVDTGVDKPSDYSKESIEALISNEPINPDSTAKAINTGTRAFTAPNVIILQLESFFDVYRLADTVFSEDPIPTFHKLMEEFPSGALTVPVIGAGTVNTEFEILTGMNMDDFGAGEYPFKSLLKETSCESIAYNLKPHGYATHAIHNHTGGFYSRNVVYGNLGIDTYTSVEYMNPIETTPMSWCKDDILIGEIAKCLDDTTEQDFICTISVQGHGSYPADVDYEPQISVEACYNQDILSSFQYYVNQIHEMDIFIANLIDYINSRDEDTVLIMYGDHLPSLDIADYNLLSGDSYTTEYIVWSNFGLDIAGDDLEAYQLCSKVLTALNIYDGVINSYHRNNSGTENYLAGLQALEYDILYGSKFVYGGENPYIASTVQMGIDAIEITGVAYDASTGYVTVTGNNFTKYSKVFVNGDVFETIFVDDTTLHIKYDELSPGDSFSVHQAKLSSTPAFSYN